MSLVISKLFGGYGNKDVVKDISFSLNRGEVLCVLGPNGCGKSTLLKLLLRFLEKTSGNIYIDDKLTDSMSCKELASKVAYIPQSHNAMFPYTVIEMVTMGRTCHMGRLNSPGKKDIKIAMEALCHLNIEKFADKVYTELSGGERQLVLIARAICQKSEFLIMDEPTSSLDYANQQLVMDSVRSLCDLGCGIIMTTHGPEQPFYVADKVILMKSGEKVGFGKPEDVLTPDSMEQVYGIQMDIIKVKDRYDRYRSICLPISKCTA